MKKLPDTGGVNNSGLLAAFLVGLGRLLLFIKRREENKIIKKQK